MASSGTIPNDFATGYRLQIVWSVTSQNIAENYSNVTASLQLVSTGYHITSSTSKSCSQNIDGTGFSSTCTVGLAAYETKTLMTSNQRVYHNSDGTKTCSFSGSVAMNVTLSGTYYGTVSVSGTANLDTIARASQPSLSVSSLNYGASVTITTNRASSSFTHTIRYDWNGHTGTIASNVTDNTTWTVPNSFMDYIPNATSSWGTIYCDTYNGSTLIGTKTVTLTTNVPSTVVPTFTSITGAELTTTVSSIVGKYVQKLSNIRLTINGAAGTYSSTISAYKINYNGADYNSNTIDTGVIGWSGNLTVTATITDSRGRTASKTLVLNALPYNYPTITAFSLQRCNSDGTANDMGTSGKITTAAIVSSLLNSTEKNSLTYSLFARVRGTTTWIPVKAPALCGLSVNATDTVKGFIKQVETSTVVGTITTAGTVKVTVRAADMTGSPKVLNVAVLLNDTASSVAGKIRTALSADSTITGFFTVGGTGATVQLTAKNFDITDTTMNIAIENGTCAGLTNTTTSTGSDNITPFDAAESYDWRVDVTDKFNTTLSINTMSTGKVCMSWGIDGIGVGKVWEQGALDVNGDIYEDGVNLLDKYAPAGVIQMYAGLPTAIPSGWLICDGTAVSRSTYSRLFAALGTTYGSGDGSSTFNLPNLKGKVPVGQDTNDDYFNALGETGGEKKHTLTLEEIPSHDGHFNPWPGTGGLWGYVNYNNVLTPYGSTGRGWNVQQNNELIPYTENRGSSWSHNNLQPYIVLNYIIRT